jgi:hypothetical protein
LVDQRHAHYHFTVKANQPTLLDDLTLLFQDRKQPHFVMLDALDHERIETRSIWTTTALNSYLDFPHVAQAFAIERIVIDKKTGKPSRDIAYSITSRPPHRPMLNACLRSTAVTGRSKTVATISSIGTTTRTAAASVPVCVYAQAGHGPENITRLRRFAIGVIKSKGVQSVAQKMRQLNKNTRLVFDYLRMTTNSCPSRFA